tara:strand:+ start:147 stop:293 length:147 start_codon:yes stop_codon:yes gene_type:complete
MTMTDKTAITIANSFIKCGFTKEQAIAEMIEKREIYGVALALKVLHKM